MNKIIASFCFLLLVITASFAQTDGELTQAEKNKQKVAELKAKLDNVSMKDDDIQNQDSVAIRLKNIEEQMALLLAEVQSLKKEQQQSAMYFTSPSGEDQINAYTVLKKMDLFLEGKNNDILIQKGRDDNSLTHSVISKVNKAGDFYIIVESQHTLELIKKAKEMYVNKNGSEVLILHNTLSGWYYLTEPNTLKYKQALEEIGKHRKAGLDKTWWVSASDVEQL